MKTQTTHNFRPQAGFTLIETLIAIFILALTIGALLTLTAGGFFSIRYAKNDIVANTLLQESLEYIRNTRDTAGEQGTVWDDWVFDYQDNGCFGQSGCIINPYTTTTGGDAIASCNGVGTNGGPNDCDPLAYYTDAGFYAYTNLSKSFTSSVTPLQTSFIRNIFFKDVTTPGGDKQILVTARMDWKNGTNPKHVEQSIILTPWNIQQ